MSINFLCFTTLKDNYSLVNPFNASTSDQRYVDTLWWNARIDLRILVRNRYGVSKHSCSFDMQNIKYQRHCTVSQYLMFGKAERRIEVSNPVGTPWLHDDETVDSTSSQRHSTMVCLKGNIHVALFYKLQYKVSM